MTITNPFAFAAIAPIKNVHVMEASDINWLPADKEEPFFLIKIVRVKAIKHHVIGNILFQCRAVTGEVLMPLAKQVLQQDQRRLLVLRVVDFWYELHCSRLNLMG